MVTSQKISATIQQGNQVLNEFQLTPADAIVFTLPANCKIISATERHSTAGSDGGAVTLQLRKCLSGQAIAAGTDMLSTAFNMKGTANTPQTSGIVATTADCAAGTAIALDYTGTLTALAGVSVAVVYQLA